MSIKSRTPPEARRCGGTPGLVILALAALLGLGAIALGGGGGSTERRAAGVTPAHVALVERRVEALRGLRFVHPVPVAIVSPAQARRQGLGDYDRSEPPAQQRTDEELLKLLGLLPRSASLRAIESDVYGEQVAGYYDPRRKRLALVRGAGVDDVTLAHELTHALEDQHANLQRLDGGGRGDDASTAQQALVEGSATLVMERYAARWPSPTPLGDALAGLAQTATGTPLPGYMMRTLVFPYFQGEAFVQALRDADAGGWKLVDVAERARPPIASAEILQPSRWLRAQQPLTVAVRVAPPHADGWRRLAGSTLGEEDVAALLAPHSGPAAARALTGGWRGGRWMLWRRGPLAPRGCASPCRARDALLLAVRMQRPAQAHALAAALGTWLREGLLARPLPAPSPAAGGAASRRPAAHAAAWRLPGGSAALVRVRGGEVRVALAPSAAGAARLAR